MTAIDRTYVLVDKVIHDLGGDDLVVPEVDEYKLFANKPHAFFHFREVPDRQSAFPLDTLIIIPAKDVRPLRCENEQCLCKWAISHEMYDEYRDVLEPTVHYCVDPDSLHVKEVVCCKYTASIVLAFKEGLVFNDLDIALEWVEQEKDSRAQIQGAASWVADN
jgi:hypothetical protein